MYHGMTIYQYIVASLRSGESFFKLVSFLKAKLWSFKVRKLDVCGRPLFANSVTNNGCIYIPCIHVVQIKLFVCAYAMDVIRILRITL